MPLYSLLLFVHLAGVAFWVGGMAFAYFCLRPAAGALLQPPQRLPLWAAVFGRFLPMVGVAVVAILASGLVMFMQVGFRVAPIGWHAMLLLGVLMSLLYAWIAVRLYPLLRRHAAAGEWPQAARALDRIRHVVAVNLGLSVLTIAAAALGRAY